jgi:hypothetical protein
VRLLTAPRFLTGLVFFKASFFITTCSVRRQPDAVASLGQGKSSAPNPTILPQYSLRAGSIIGRHDDHG